MQSLSDGQMAKLPKWAQEHLKTCYMRIDELKEAKHILFDQPSEDARVVLTRFYSLDAGDTSDQGLEDHQLIKFYPKADKGRWDEYIEVGLTRDEETITVRGCLTSIQIEPDASNSIRVRLKDRKR